VVHGDTDPMIDVFIRDWRAGTTERISQTYTGKPPTSHSLLAAINHDGRYVAFSSNASDLPQATPTTLVMCSSATGGPAPPVWKA
jgi:TolB protein